MEKLLLTVREAAAASDGGNTLTLITIGVLGVLVLTGGYITPYATRWAR
jgi:hypothetical protein